MRQIFRDSNYKKKERKKNKWIINDKFSETSFRIAKLIVNVVLVNQNKEQAKDNNILRSRTRQSILYLREK